jgi:hypothetical protein
MVKPPLRTKTLGTKLSEAEFAQLEAAARERGLTLSEWCRQVLLANVNGQGSNADSGATGQALMAELVALRTILLNLHFRIAKGEPITAEAMQEIIDRADARPRRAFTISCCGSTVRPRDASRCLTPQAWQRWTSPIRRPGTGMPT